MSLYKLKVFQATPKRRPGPPRSIRRRAGRGEPNGAARARALDRLRNGPSGARKDWRAVGTASIIGAVLIGVFVMALVLMSLFGM